mmetsp:Transcript_22937/g.54114  ORF Transcript_22937/g.54114 Transcript_22937/m.54114 type:complete len:103 (+) Transcript_22937:134-442(+)
MPPSISGTIHGIIDNAARQTPQLHIRPHRFIVAWNGVLTLAFESWPAELTVVKRQVSNVPEFKEAKENFGAVSFPYSFPRPTIDISTGRTALAKGVTGCSKR